MASMAPAGTRLCKHIEAAPLPSCPARAHRGTQHLGCCRRLAPPQTCKHDSVQHPLAGPASCHKVASQSSQCPGQVPCLHMTPDEGCESSVRRARTLQWRLEGNKSMHLGLLAQRSGALVCA